MAMRKTPTRKRPDPLPAPVIEPLALSPREAAQRLGISVRSVYDKLATGELRGYKDGRRRKIPDAECQRLVRTKTAEAA